MSLSKDKEDIKKGNCIKKSATFKISIRKPIMDKRDKRMERRVMGK